MVTLGNGVVTALDVTELLQVVTVFEAACGPLSSRFHPQGLEVLEERLQIDELPRTTVDDGSPVARRQPQPSCLTLSHPPH